MQDWKTNVGGAERSHLLQSSSGIDRLRSHAGTGRRLSETSGLGAEWEPSGAEQRVRGMAGDWRPTAADQPPLPIDSRESSQGWTAGTNRVPLAEHQQRQLVAVDHDDDDAVIMMDCSVPPQKPVSPVVPSGLEPRSQIHAAMPARGGGVVHPAAPSTGARGVEPDVWIDPRPVVSQDMQTRMQPSDDTGLFVAAPPDRVLEPLDGIDHPQTQAHEEDAERKKLLADPNKVEAMRQLQEEMGFSEMQVIEAFKRCSTAEAAVDWIVSHEFGADGVLLQEIQ